MTPEPDEFALWKQHPVTRWVMQGLRNAMEQDRAEWMRVSWDAAPADGKVSPAMLIELRTRHDAFGEVVNYTLEEWERMHEQS